MADTTVPDRHASVANRQQVAVGSLQEAYEWADRHGVPHGQLQCACGLRALIGLDPLNTHLVLMSSYWDLPQHYLLRTEVAMLSQHGATVEWA